MRQQICMMNPLKLRMFGDVDERSRHVGRRRWVRGDSLGVPVAAGVGLPFRRDPGEQPTAPLRHVKHGAASVIDRLSFCSTWPTYPDSFTCIRRNAPRQVSIPTPPDWMTTTSSLSLTYRPSAKGQQRPTMPRKRPLHQMRHYPDDIAQHVSHPRIASPQLTTTWTHRPTD